MALVQWRVFEAFRASNKQRRLVHFKSPTNLQTFLLRFRHCHFFNNIHCHSGQEHYNFPMTTFIIIDHFPIHTQTHEVYSSISPPSSFLLLTFSSFMPYSIAPFGKRPRILSARPAGVATRPKTMPRPIPLEDWCRNPETHSPGRFCPVPLLAQLSLPGSQAFARRLV